MDRFLAAFIDKEVPDVNKDVMDGYALVQMNNIEDYIAKLVHSISRSMPPGIRFKKMVRCSPEEEYRDRTKLKTNKRSYDIAKLDFYYVKFIFEHNGEELPPRYKQIPFAGEGTIFHISGTKYHITPVLSHKVLSPGENSVFVQLIRDRFTFHRSNYAFIADNVTELSHVVWSNIYRRAKKAQNNVSATTKANVCIMHYFLGKYGLKNTFQKFLGFEPIVGTEEEITADKYPESDWVICQSYYRSIGGKPLGYIQNTYSATRLRLAIRRDKWDNYCKYMVAGLFYCLDHFPTEMHSKELLENTSLWKVLMGHIVFSGQYGWDKLHDSITEHYQYVDKYVDNVIVEKVAARGYIIEDFYDLLGIILRDFNELIHDEKASNLNMYGKVLETRYYLLDAMVQGLMTTIFNLNKLSSKRVLSNKDIVDAFNKSWRPGMIISSISNNRDITSVVSCSTDHKYPKITSHISEQEGRSNDSKGNNTGGRLFDISMAVVGNAFYMSKSNPSPTSRLSLFAKVDPLTCETMENSILRDVHDATDVLLRKHREDISDTTLLE